MNILSKLAAAAVVALGLAAPAAAESLTPKDAAEMLTGAAVEVLHGNRVVCSGAKIGEKQFLTAKHCLGRDMKVRWDYSTHAVRSVLMGIGDDEDEKGYDWAVLNTFTDSDKIDTLAISCDEEPYLGMPVAYMGFPIPFTEPAFFTGHVASVDPIGRSYYNHNFAVTANAAPGSSGSGIISMDTGFVIGVLTEGVLRDRFYGLIATGIDTFPKEDLCPVIKKEESKSSDGSDLNRLKRSLDYPESDPLDPIL